MSLGLFYTVNTNDADLTLYLIANNILIDNLCFKINKHMILFKSLTHFLSVFMYNESGKKQINIFHYITLSPYNITNNSIYLIVQNIINRLSKTNWFEKHSSRNVSLVV